MEQTKIPFDISLRPEIEAGKYRVETRGGRPARIICWDAKHGESDKFSFSIIALVDKGEFGEFSYNFTDKGRWDLRNDTALDLFLVPVEPEPDEVRGGETLHWRKGPYYIPSGGAMCLIRTKQDTPDNGYLYYVEYRMDIAEYEEFIPISELEKLPKED